MKIIESVEREISFQYFPRKKFGFCGIGGAMFCKPQNSARAKREGLWRMWRNRKNSKGFPKIFLEKMKARGRREDGSLNFIQSK